MPSTTTPEIRPTATIEDVETYAETLKRQVDEASEALERALDTATEFMDEVLGSVRGLRHQHAIWSEAKSIRDDLAGDSGSDFDIARTTWDAKDLVELVRFAIAKSEVDDV